MSKYINTDLLDIEHIKSAINEEGYCVLKNIIDSEYIDLQKLRWTRKLALREGLKNFVRGNLILGEKNFSSYSNIPKLNLYRYYEFLWNETDDPDSHDVHLYLNKVRNQIKGDPENKGIIFNEECYGIYISTSLYENEGYLHSHADGHGKDSILHYMLPLTFKDSGFNKGGLVIWDKKDNKIMVEDLVEEGSIIFFDGRQKHGVEIIHAMEGQPGRLASFAIPCYFQKDTRLALLKRGLAIQVDQTKNKLSKIF